MVLSVLKAFAASGWQHARFDVASVEVMELHALKPATSGHVIRKANQRIIVPYRRIAVMLESVDARGKHAAPLASQRTA